MVRVEVGEVARVLASGSQAHGPLTSRELIAHGLPTSLYEGLDRVDSFAPRLSRAAPCARAVYVVGPRLLHSPEEGSVSAMQ